MLGVVVFAVRVKGKHSKLLIAQALYFVFFFIAILSISYFWVIQA